jgi:hypothetical protein
VDNTADRDTCSSVSDTAAEPQATPPLALTAPVAPEAKSPDAIRKVCKQPVEPRPATSRAHPFGIARKRKNAELELVSCDCFFLFSPHFALSYLRYCREQLNHHRTQAHGFPSGIRVATAEMAKRSLSIYDDDVRLPYTITNTLDKRFDHCGIRTRSPLRAPDSDVQCMR